MCELTLNELTTIDGGSVSSWLNGFNNATMKNAVAGAGAGLVVGACTGAVDIPETVAVGYVGGWTKGAISYVWDTI